MKFFDYRCTACDKRAERVVKRHDDPVRCECGEPMVKMPPPTRTTFRFADKRP